VTRIREGALPPYIARGGDLVMAPPLELEATTMYAFLAGADLAALTALIDTQLNAVTGGSTIYKPLLPMVSIVCADVANSFSQTPPDSTKGWMSERDFGIWVPVVAGTEVGGVFVPARIGWYLPYVFVDNVAAMVTGREVFGFFKQIATLLMPRAPELPGMFSIDALVIPSYAATSQAEVLRLMTLTSAGPSAAPPSAPGFAAPRDLLAALTGELKRRFFDGTAGLAIPLWETIALLLAEMLTGDVPLVFLKQFRGAGAAAEACYQAVVEAPAHLAHWYGGWFTHPHDVTILPCDSHPIARDCGLPAKPFRAELGFWTSIEFIMQPGVVIAER
jgi:hypothetical protein